MIDKWKCIGNVLLKPESPEQLQVLLVRDSPSLWISTGGRNTNITKAIPWFNVLMRMVESVVPKLFFTWEMICHCSRWLTLTDSTHILLTFETWWVVASGVGLTTYSWSLFCLKTTVKTPSSSSTDLTSWPIFCCWSQSLWMTVSAEWQVKCQM